MSLPKLAQYDMVLAISQDAINTQWSHLYHTPAGSPADKKYLMPHDIKIVDPDDEGTYIEGTILPPAVDFNDISADALPHETVRLKFKFVEAKDKSFFVTSVVRTINGKKTIVDVKEDLHGWTFSFEASIASKDIQSILEAGLKEDAQKALKPYVPTAAVPSVDFLAASIYCLFESSQIVKSVRLTDTDGKEPSDVTRTTFVAALVTYFTKLNNDAAEAGKHPYVMGYTVHQQPNRPVGASEMVPAKFQMSTTADTTAFSTVNFLMLEKNDTVVDANAGVFSETFFKKVNQTTHNGVLGMSADIFAIKFIVRTVVPAFQNKPPTNKKIASQSSQTPTPSSATNITWTDTWAAETTKDSDAFLYWRKWDFNGVTTNTITYTSLSLTNPVEASKPDSKHVITMRVKQTYAIHSLVETAVRGPLSDKWSYAFETDMQYDIETVYLISPGEDGKLIATYDAQQSRFPPMQNGTLKTRLITAGIDPGPKPGEEDAIPVRVQFHGVFSFGDVTSLFFSMILPGFSEAISGSIAQGYELKDFNNAGSQLTGIKDKIIMPAGDVLTFAGMDSDSEGHVYCAIDYRTLSDGSTKP